MIFVVWGYDVISCCQNGFDVGEYSLSSFVGFYKVQIGLRV